MDNPEKNSNTLEEETEELKRMLKLMDGTGIRAWDVGERLNELKKGSKYLWRYNTFERYTKQSVGISPQTANNYIKIHENFDRDELGDVMLLTHLLAVCEMQDKETRSNALRVLRQDIEKSKQGDYKLSAADIGNFITALQSSPALSNEAESILQKFKKELEKDKETAREGNNQKNGGTLGGDFNKLEIVEPFRWILDHFEYVPRDEMGLVAVFCLLFRDIAEIPFAWNGKMGYLKRFRYARVPFPDAEMYFKRANGEEKDVLKVEFEHRSHNYIEHRHYKLDKPSEPACHLVICWENNSIGKTNAEKTPPIIALKEVLETGEIIPRQAHETFSEGLLAQLKAQYKATNNKGLLARIKNLELIASI